MKEGTGYNGWANYYTWAAHIYTNEESKYDHFMHLAKAAKIDDDPPAALANLIKEELQEGAPGLPASLYSDMLYYALGEVNYTEVAKALLEDI